MKQITCSAIEKLPEDWNFWRKVIDREKYLNLDINSFPDTVRFCLTLDGALDLHLDDYIEPLESKFRKLSTKDNTEITHNPCKTNIEILQRIGSQSADGEVYNIRVRGIGEIQELEFAMKLMPRIDANSKNRNVNEILIAQEASKYPDYFPKAVAFGYCDKTSFYSKDISINISQSDVSNNISGFVSKAIEFHNYNLLLSQLDNTRIIKRFDADYRNGLNLLELSGKYNLKYENTKEIEVDFLISELANGDLGNWMKQNRSILEWKKVVLDIITGTYYLSVVLRKVHPDLHPGNVLIISPQSKDSNSTSVKDSYTESSRSIKALIHDFGRCYSVNDEIPETYKASLLSFCQEFISCSTRNDLIIPRNILIGITDILNIAKKTKINGSNIKDIYEQIFFPIIVNIS
jgi:hypothetical protein